MRRLAALALLLALAALAACGLRVREESLVDRCGDVMRQAFPGGDIRVTRKETLARPTESIATFYVAAEGTRRNVPPDVGVPLREVAVECRFDDGILTGFHWTKGPLR